jgi:thymidylate synthase
MQVVANTLDDILQRIFKKLLASSQTVDATRGRTRELLGVSIKLRQPRARLSHTEQKGRVFSAIGELLWYLAKTKSLRFIEYYLPNYGVDNSEDGKTIYGAYGPRLFGMNGINQVENILGLLRERPNSRRAVVQLFDAKDINARRLEIPCTCTLQFLLRRGALDLIVYTRSNDAYLGFSHDVFAFTMLQELMARSLSAGIGTYHHFVGSLHLYQRDEQKARQYIEEGWQSTVNAEIPPMPAGNPWPSVKQLLRIELNLRKGREVDIARGTLNPYWQDLARLLAIFRASKDGDAQNIQTLRSEMASDVFDEYIEQREERIERRKLTGQMRLAFEDPIQVRTVVPRWLNQLTKSLLAGREESKDIANAVIPWAAPAPFFGNISSAVIATVAVNPSDREFCDGHGAPLPDVKRRLETLGSLSLASWADTHPRHYKLINLTALHYFLRNPYSIWFRDLEQILEGAEASYYETRTITAVHIDLVPFATQRKWTSLSSRQRGTLLDQHCNGLADLVKRSGVRVLVLNGATVAKQLEKLAGMKFARTTIDEWRLCRRSGRHVAGVGIQGSFSMIGNTPIGREVAVIGYNHNLQSSYGVTTEAKERIKAWVCERIIEVLNET